MKKICMIVPSFSAKGGIAAVVSGYRGSEIEKKYNISYIETYSDKNTFKKILKAVEAYATFVKELLCGKPDIVHIHSSFGASFYRKLPFIKIAKVMGVPIVNHIHGADFDDFFVNAVNRKKKKIISAYRKCNKLIALSEQWKNMLSEIVPQNQLEVVENYSTIHKNDKEVGMCKNTILFLGFLCERKGCFDIPNVIAAVKKNIPDVRFVLAGSGDKNDINRIKTECKKLNINNNVCFPGWVRDKEKDELLRIADVFFLPSYYEGMPMAILDAMGYGLPIVTTNVGGIPEIVQHNRNGYVCEPGRIHTFAKLITELLNDDEKRIGMGKQSLEIINERFSLNLHIKKLTGIYNEVMNEENI